MTDVRLQPPFDRELVETIVANRLALEGDDLSHTAEWLLNLNDTDRMTEAVREAWEKSDLPLHDWADLITGVFAYMTDREDCIWLEVALAGWEEHEVLQQAPFTPVMLKTCGWMRRSPIPEVMSEVALSAPGLELKEAILIGVPQAYLQPMGSIRRWMKDAPVILNDTKQELPLDFFVAEVATDCEGNQFVLGGDDRLYFFGHEVGVMFRCRLNLEELIAAFFRSPEQLLDADFLGVKW